MASGQSALRRCLAVDATLLSDKLYPKQARDALGSLTGTTAPQPRLGDDGNFHVAVSAGDGTDAAVLACGKGEQCLLVVNRTTAALHEPCTPDSRITCLKWAGEYLFIGDSGGRVRAFNMRGDAVFTQQLLELPILQMETCDGHALAGDSARGDDTMTLWVLHTESYMCSLPWKLVRESISRRLRMFDTTARGQRIPQVPYRQWYLNGQFKSLGVTCCRPYAQGMFDDYSLHHTTIVSAGTNPCVAEYHAGMHHPPATLGTLASAVASKLTSAMSSAVTSFAASWWGGGYGASEEEDSKLVGEGEDVYLPADDTTRASLEHLDTVSAVHDPTRTASQAVADPSGRLVATCDGFGRVMIVRSQSLHVMRMFKGYRDAQVGWLRTVDRWEGQWTGASMPRVGAPGAGEGLYLVLHSPRRGTVELWRMINGPRVAVVKVGPGARIMTTPPGFGAEYGGRCFVFHRRNREGAAASYALDEVHLGQTGLQNTFAFFAESSNELEGRVAARVMAALAAAGIDNSAARRDDSASEAGDDVDAAPITDAQREALWNDIRVSVKQLNSPVLLRRVLAAATLVEVDLGLERQRYVTQLLREAIGTAVEQLTGGKRAEEAGVRAGVAAPDPVGEAFRELQTELDQRRQLLQAYEFMVEPLVSWGHEHAMGSDPLRDSDIGHEIRYWRVHNASGGASSNARSEGESTLPSVDTGAGAGAGAGAAAGTGSNGTEGHATDTADHADEDTVRSKGDVGFPQPLRLPFVEFLLCFQPCQSRASSATSRQTPVAAFAVRQNQVSQRARSRLVRFLFQILLLDPFVLNSWRQCNQVLGLRANDVTTLFLEWFFTVSVDDLLCTPASASSSGLRRWLQQLLRGDIGAPPPSSPTGRSRARTASGGTVVEAADAATWSAESTLFNRCLHADELEHALLLATFCQELQGSGSSRDASAAADSGSETTAPDWDALVQQLRAALMFRHLTKEHSFRRAVSASRLAEDASVYALIAGMCVESELRSSAAVGKEINLQAVSRATTMALAAAATANHGGSKWDAMKRDLTGNLNPLAIAIRYCGIRLKPDNLKAHRSWVLAEYWDRNLHLYRALWGSVATAVSVHNDDVRVGLLLALWKRFIAPRLSSVLYHIRTNKAIGGRDAGAGRDGSTPAASSSLHASSGGPFTAGATATAAVPDVPAAGDTATLVLHPAWCSGVFKAASAVLRNLLRPWRSVDEEGSGDDEFGDGADGAPVAADDDFIQQLGDELGGNSTLVCVAGVLRHLTLTCCMAAARERCLNAHIVAIVGADAEWLTLQSITTALPAGAATGPGELTPHLDVDTLAAGLGVDLVSPGAFGYGEVVTGLDDGVVVGDAARPRMQFVVALLQYGSPYAPHVAERLRVPIMAANRHLACVSYREGLDAQADEILAQLPSADARSAAPVLLQVARARLRQILMRMRKRPSDAVLLTDVDPRVVDWICGERGIDVRPRSLRLTYNLLLRLLPLMNESSDDGHKASDMLRLAHALLRGIEKRDTASGRA